MQSVAKLLNMLEVDDYKVLAALSDSIPHHKLLTRVQLAYSAKLQRDKADFTIDRLKDFKLVTVTLDGIGLLMAGLDAIALKAFVDRNIISGLGMPIGVGKESDVFEAITANGQTRAIKFFRIGRISFRQVRRKRSYVDKISSRNWILTNIQAAQTEYSILQKLQHAGMAIPKPYYRRLHTIVMSRIKGENLVDAKDIHNPKQLLFDILHEVRLAYNLNIINCDLSEYNIMVDGDNRPWIIDWPQAVTQAHPNA
ncbi:MAG TPA: RIO1 family regulatory kinase/ATPase, partial [Nitrososphaeraceae archaeon]|nr:RIO1 family regulatory kinase/ATPase [Nitrososphaeraceae archaeon]